MFDSWIESTDYRTLFLLDRQVRVDTARLFPATGIRKDELPLWVKTAGLLVEPSMPARQIAWLRRSDGGWVAAVAMPVRSANGRSRLTMQLWLPADALSPSDQLTRRLDLRGRVHTSSSTATLAVHDLYCVDVMLNSLSHTKNFVTHRVGVVVHARQPRPGPVKYLDRQPHVCGQILQPLGVPSGLDSAKTPYTALPRPRHLVMRPWRFGLPVA